MRPPRSTRDEAPSGEPDGVGILHEDILHEDIRHEDILHETARRLRLRLAPGADTASLRAELEQLPGVSASRINAALQCVVVQHDGRAETRAAVLQQLRGGVKAGPPQRRARAPDGSADAAAWAAALLAATLPLLPQAWRRNTAMAVIGARVLSQPARLRSDAPAVLLDAASLAALAVSGQPLVVATSVLLRLLSEHLSARLVRQADGLLAHVLPNEAARYTALRGTDDSTAWAWWPPRALRAGDRVRLFAGDVVPLDGCVVDGSATLAPEAQHGAMRAVAPGEHLAAGVRLHSGTIELRAEADAASSRLQRLRSLVQHAMHAEGPVDGTSPQLGRLLSLPLTAATLVFGLTGDSARAAAMLQADPQQGLDLALPLGREAALYALARQGLLTAGFEAIERLATARTLVLQDTGVLTTGRWAIEAVATEPGGDADQVRGWLAALAGTPLEVLASASFPDRVVRQWVRHGAVLRIGEHEVHLTSRQRWQQVWGRSRGRQSELQRQPDAKAGTAAARARLSRELLVVASGRVVARVVLASPWRPQVEDRLAQLAALGFDRIAMFVEAAGALEDAPPTTGLHGLPGLEAIADESGLRADWVAEVQQTGTPLLFVHTLLRDLVPPGSLSLSPMDADIGSHGVLLGDPLQSLVAARRIAVRVHRRLRWQQRTAVAANAVLMTAAGLRWLPPIATTLLHHGHALLLLLDSLRIEALDAPSLPSASRASPASPPPARPASSRGAKPRTGASRRNRILRSEPT